MEIVYVEAGVFGKMLSRLKELERKVKELCEKYGEKGMQEWLDTQDVCLLLNVSPRTVKYMRERGKLSSTHLGKKVYYKVENVRNLLPVMAVARKMELIKSADIIN